MSIIKKTIPTLLIILITWCGQLSAEEIKKIGKYKDWQAMTVTDGSGKICLNYVFGSNKMYQRLSA